MFAHHVNLFKPRRRNKLMRVARSATPVATPMTSEAQTILPPNKPHVYQSYPTLIHQITEDIVEHEQKLKIPKPNSPEFKTIFMYKLNVGEQVLTAKDSEQRMAKRIALRQIADTVITIGFGTFLDQEMQDKLFEVIYLNLIRPVPKFVLSQFLNVDSSCFSIVDWEHLEYIYTILQAFYKNFPKLPYFNKNFFDSLVPLISSKDHNERDHVATLLTTFYLNNQQYLVSFIETLSKIMKKHLESPDPCSVYTCLLILSKFIGVSFEIKKMIFQFCRNILVLLIRDKYLSLFINPMTSCLKFLLSSSKEFTNDILHQVISYWPVSDPSKQVPMFNIISCALKIEQSANDQAIISETFRHIGHLCDSDFAKIAEMSCKIFHDNSIISLLIAYSLETVSDIYLHVKQALNHWSPSVKEAAQVTLRVLNQLSPLDIFDDSRFKNKTTNWVAIARIAAKNDKSINLTTKLGEMAIIYQNRYVKTLVDAANTESFPLTKIRSVSITKSCNTFVNAF